MNKTVWKRIVLVCLGMMPLTAFAATGGGEKAFSWQDFLGPFHNVVLHYPIGFVTMVCIMEIYGYMRPSEELRKFIRLTWWLVIGSTVLTSALGFARASDGGYNAETLQAHKVAGIAVIVLATVALAVSRQRFSNPEKENNGVLRMGYGAMLIATFVAMVVAGHKGGDLTHGADYLTKNAPSVLKELFEPAKGTNENDSLPVAGAAAAEPSFFAEKVWPVFEQKCVKCHGDAKHKGDYRMDTREFALKAGDSEIPPIVPGKPEESYLVELISLTEDDDEVMPPSGKEPLTDEEKAAIKQWIKDGASYDLTKSD